MSSLFLIVIFLSILFIFIYLFTYFLISVIIIFNIGMYVGHPPPSSSLSTRHTTPHGSRPDTARHSKARNGTITPPGPSSRTACVITLCQPSDMC